MERFSSTSLIRFSKTRTDRLSWGFATPIPLMRNCRLHPNCLLQTWDRVIVLERPSFYEWIFRGVAAPKSLSRRRRLHHCRGGRYTTRLCYISGVGPPKLGAALGNRAIARRLSDRAHAGLGVRHHRARCSGDANGCGAQSAGRWDQSVAYFEQALALDPRNVELLSLAAWGYCWHRQFPAALKLFDRALDITPNDPTLMAGKAGIYQSEGNLQEAARSLPEINWETSPAFALAYKIFQLRFERNYGEAVRLLQARVAQFRYASQQDKDIERLTLALIQRTAGDTAGAKVTAEQARNSLEPLYRDQPHDWSSAALLSQAYAVMGEKELGLKLAERAITILPLSKDALNGPDLEENLALIQTMFGENNRAISILTQLLQTSYCSGLERWVVTPAV